MTTDSNNHPTSKVITERRHSYLLLTVEEAAEKLRIGRTNLYALIKDGQIETITVGSLRRVPVACLYEYINRLRTNA